VIKETKNVLKYKDFRLETQHLERETRVIPVIIAENGTVSVVQIIPEQHTGVARSELHKTTILDTEHILWKILLYRGK
jgi:hypothetical protein